VDIREAAETAKRMIGGQVDDRLKDLESIVKEQVETAIPVEESSVRAGGCRELSPIFKGTSGERETQ